MVKIDIEGSEWEILEDARLRVAARVVVLEYHPQGRQGRIPRLAAHQARPPRMLCRVLLHTRPRVWGCLWRRSAAARLMGNEMTGWVKRWRPPG